jgi:NAD(P)-dependent dehydrogenase (short-subunit alcohol dehydrogenase family)
MSFLKSSLVAFVIGSGQNIGDSTAAALKAQGYKVAVGSRKPAVEERQRDGYLPVAMDAHSPEGVKAAFAHVNAELGPPSVVVFNTGASSSSFNSGPGTAADGRLGFQAFL